MQALLAEGVSTRRGIMNSHQEPAYAGLRCGPLPHSEAARDSVILLPLYDAMTAEEQARVVAGLRRAAATARAG
jgi:dTDP-4-amino-4,6-dideoxygalactose transaminase